MTDRATFLGWRKPRHTGGGPDKGPSGAAGTSRPPLPVTNRGGYFPDKSDGRLTMPTLQAAIDEVRGLCTETMTVTTPSASEPVGETIWLCLKPRPCPDHPEETS